MLDKERQVRIDACSQRGSDAQSQGLELLASKTHSKSDEIMVVNDEFDLGSNV
jgi:hypothetical protein